jgi:hypothetical protein
MHLLVSSMTTVKSSNVLGSLNKILQNENSFATIKNTAPFKSLISFRGLNSPSAQEANEAVKKLKYENPSSKFTITASSTKRAPTYDYKIDPTCNTITQTVNDTTIIGDLLEVYFNRVCSLYDKRALVCMYVGEGLEEGEFSEAQEDLRIVIDSYKMFK